eukprot:scaffold10093_cov167-Skeletonema_dohrnii-CCMP3373.AAC.1
MGLQNRPNHMVLHSLYAAITFCCRNGLISSSLLLWQNGGLSVPYRVNHLCPSCSQTAPIQGVYKEGHKSPQHTRWGPLGPTSLGRVPFVSVLASWYQASPPTEANIKHLLLRPQDSMLCPAHSCFLMSIDITYLSSRRSDQSLLVPPPSIMFPATLTWQEQDRRSTSASASHAYADHCL